MIVKTGIGQDSHRFELEKKKKLMIAGVCFDDQNGLKGNSDADVVLHALCNSISSISGETILGPVSDKMCKEGITDSAEYLKVALKSLSTYKITHVSISLECLKPKINPKIPEMKKKIATLMNLMPEDIGITATTGEGLTDFGKGLGIQAFSVITVIKE